MKRIIITLLFVTVLFSGMPAQETGNHRNFKVSVYARAYEVREIHPYMGQGKKLLQNVRNYAQIPFLQGVSSKIKV